MSGKARFVPHCRGRGGRVTGETVSDKPHEMPFCGQLLTRAAAADTDRVAPSIGGASAATAIAVFDSLALGADARNGSLSDRFPWSAVPVKNTAPAPVPPSPRQGSSMPGDWPLRSFLELGALASAVPCARWHARQVLWEWRLTELSEQAELLASELVTNSVKASQALEQVSPVRFWLLSDQTCVLVMVWDANLQPPTRVHAAEDAEGGRGLLLVETLSERWDWYAPPSMGGKVTWALISGFQ